MGFLMRKANIICGLAGMTFSAVVFIQTLSFREFPNVHMGPEAFPRLMAAGLFICSLILVLQAIITKTEKTANGTAAQAGSSPPWNLKSMLRLLTGVAIITVYAWAWQPVGFLVTTPFAMFAIMFLIGFRQYLKMIIFSLLTPAVIFYAFSFFLNVNMPLGILRNVLF